MEKNWSYTIEEGEHAGKTIWSGRYTAVTALVFCEIKDEWYVLANKRGKGTPDYQGRWNVPCGFLEMESGEEACAREVYEETGVRISPERFVLHSIETDPKLCNNGNVSIRYVCTLIYGFDDISTSKSAVLNGDGEKDEVDDISWIPLEKLDDYEWAFRHREIIPEIFGDMLDVFEEMIERREL